MEIFIGRKDKCKYCYWSVLNHTLGFPAFCDYDFERKRKRRKDLKFEKRDYRGYTIDIILNHMWD